MESSKSKIVEFLTSTTSNEGFSEKQYNLFDHETNGLSFYCQDENLDYFNQKVRRGYFDGEVGTWGDEKINEWVETFNL